MAALVLIGHEELHHCMQQAVVDTDADPVAQVVALVRALVLAHTDLPLLALVANQELHALSPDRASPALALREQSRDLALRVLRRGVQQQVFDIPDITLAAIAISSMGRSRRQLVRPGSALHPRPGRRRLRRLRPAPDRRHLARHETHPVAG